MCTLRSAQISTVEYKKVLFLSVEDPTEGNAAQILQFPGIGFLKGDPRKKRDLLRAGINNADKVVLINLRNSMSEVGEDDVSLEYLDSNTIVVSHLIHSMFRGRAKKYVVNDLQEKENIKFLRPTILKHSKKAIVKEEGTINTSRRAFTEDSYTYTPIFAGGRVIASSMLGSILYQTYYNPLIVKTFEYFCGVRRSVGLWMCFSIIVCRIM